MLAMPYKTSQANDGAICSVTRRGGLEEMLSADTDMAIGLHDLQTKLFILGPYSVWIYNFIHTGVSLVTPYLLARIQGCIYIYHWKIMYTAKG